MASANTQSVVRRRRLSTPENFLLDRMLIPFQTRSLQRSPSVKETQTFNTRQRNDLQQNDVKIRSCIECIKIVPVFSPDDIEEGDHVVDIGSLYDHHMIITDKKTPSLFEIVEATNTAKKFWSALLTSEMFGGKAKLVISERELDFEKNNIGVVVYKDRKFTKPETASRALEHYEKTSEHYKYNLFENNCEHLATYCVTGEMISLQVEAIEIRILSLSTKKSRSDWEQQRHKKLFKRGIICKPCYEMNTKLLSATPIRIDSKADVKPGDIIQFSCNDCWEQAVVLTTNNPTKRTVDCVIAHYILPASSSRKTIMRENKTIKFGEVYKLNYDLSKFEIYKAKDVVQRAESRVGEQKFVIFSNESSHFTRWCKLKVWKFQRGTYNVASRQFHLT